MIPIAVVGTGSAGMRHLRALRALHDVTPVAVPKRKERVLELREQGFVVAESLQAVAQQGVRHCIIATDTRDHVADTLLALEQGMDVLVEKPVTPTAADTASLREHAAMSKRRVWVASPLRFSRSMRDFRSNLPSLGSIHAVRIECRSYLPEWRPERPYAETYSARAEDGGVLRDLIHEIDYATWLFGWPKAVFGRVVNTGRLKVQSEEIAEISWVTSSGSLVSVGLDYLTRPARREMRACGEGGTAAWNGIDGVSQLCGKDSVTSRSELPDSLEDLFSSQAAAFLKETTTCSDESRLASLSDGARALAICDAVRRSALQGSEETVDYLS